MSTTNAKHNLLFEDNPNAFVIAAKDDATAFLG